MLVALFWVAMALAVVSCIGAFAERDTVLMVGAGVFLTLALGAAVAA